MENQIDKPFKKHQNFWSRIAKVKNQTENQIENQQNQT